MEIIEAIRPLRAALKHLPRPVGLVPTMGFLHAGHLALIERARKETRSLVVSVFINPEQFGSHEDIKTYPRDMGSDLVKLEEAGVDLVFTPPVSEIYPPGFASYVEVGQIGERLEGEYRAGHFKGVATIVCKLISLVRPERAYFGEKDYQQTKVVAQLNIDLNLGSEIMVLPTVRESDKHGLELLDLGANNVRVGVRCGGSAQSVPLPSESKKCCVPIVAPSAAIAAAAEV